MNARTENDRQKEGTSTMGSSTTASTAHRRLRKEDEKFFISIFVKRDSGFSFVQSGKHQSGYYTDGMRRKKHLPQASGLGERLVHSRTDKSIAVRNIIY